MSKITYPQKDLEFYAQEYRNGISIAKLVEKYNLSKPSITRQLKQYGVEISNRKYHINENVFSTINHDGAYWLGFIAADGCITSTGSDPDPKVLSFNLNIRDKNHLEKFKEFCNSNAIIKEQPGAGYGEGTTMAHLEVNSKKLVADLQRYGICKAKSLILKPPPIPEAFYADWIRGYTDGDGSIYFLNQKKAAGLAFEGTEEVLTFISNFLTHNQNKVFRQRRPNPDKNTWNLKYGGTQLVVQLLHKIYDNADCYLDRKYQKVLEIYSQFEK